MRWCRRRPPPERGQRPARCGGRAAWWCGLGLVLAAGPLAADDLGRSRYLAGFDADGDGRVSELEYIDYLSRGFDQLDRDRNGLLEAHELQAGMRLPKARSRAEHRANLARSFWRQDGNGDGWLAAEELLAPPR